MKPNDLGTTTHPKAPLLPIGTQAGGHGLATHESFPVVAYPAPTPQHAKSLSQQELAEHRRKIASEVKIVLSAYFKPNEDDDIRAGQLAWWCDELQDWTQEQVVWALRQWNRDNPRARPTPGDILAVMKTMRGKREAEKLASLPKPADPDRTPVSKERAAEIMAAAGFGPRAFPSIGDGENK